MREEHEMDAVRDAKAIRMLVHALNDVPTAYGKTRDALSRTISQMAQAMARRYTTVIIVTARSEQSKQRTEGDGYLGGPY